MYLTKDDAVNAELEDLQRKLATVYEEIVALEQKNNELLKRLNELEHTDSDFDTFATHEDFLSTEISTNNQEG